jgi:iron complex transport system permease protein
MATTTTTARSPLAVGLGRGRAVGLGWWAAGVAAVIGVALVGVAVGAVAINPWRAGLEILDHVPGVHVRSGLATWQADIVWEIRLPRVVLGLLVGALLATAGAAYQGVFRNPLADPYLLGSAAGAGLGATVAIVAGASVGAGLLSPVPMAAFGGALAAVALTYLVGAAGDRLRSTATLLLAGVAVTSFLTAVQSFVQQRNSDSAREVYTWILGRLNVEGWQQVGVVLPYAAVSLGGMILLRRTIDVLAVGDEEAASLGARPARIRLLVVALASLATAAAVSVSGLIGFVGIIVPHAVRLVAGTSQRVVLPLTALFGAAFLAAADLVARTATAPAEVPIGVITALVGAPFFIVVLRTNRERL